MPNDDKAPIRFDPDAKGPLDGIRVLDLTRLVAGNMLSLQLADFGADVIKVEPPSGDPLRDWRDAGRELHWKTYARNKRSIVLHLRHDGAKEARLRLVGGADDRLCRRPRIPRPRAGAAAARARRHDRRPLRRLRRGDRAAST